MNILKSLLAASVIFLSTNHAESKESCAPPKKIEVFCDFQCPYCGLFFKKVISGSIYFEKKLNLSFEHFPLDHHAGAIPLAEVYESFMIHYQDRQYDVINYIYANAYRIKDIGYEKTRIVKMIAQYLDVDPRLVIRDVNRKDISRKIMRSIEIALKRKIEGTPTVFINNVEVTDENVAQIVMENLSKDCENDEN